MTLRKKGYGPLLVLLAAAALWSAACDMSLGNLTGRATDEWTHTYPLSPGGEIRIVNSNGRIEVDAVDSGSQVEVRAERIARGATDAAAKELLPRITIREDAKPDRITLETERLSGILIGVSYEVRYHVKAPKNAVVDLSNTNGQITMTGLAGKTVAHTTNGAVVGRSLTGEVDARTTNGAVNIDIAEVGAPIRAHTTNGGVTIGLPQNAKADVYASWTNGGMNLSPDLKIEVVDRGRRRFEGKMNGGGASVSLETTNGGIRLRPRSAETVDTEDHRSQSRP